MSKITALMMIALCVVIGLATPTPAATSLTQIGQNPFCRPPLKSEGELRDLAAREKEDLRRGFTLAGQADLYPAFEKRISQGQVDEITVQPGEKLEWMLFRKNGKGPVRVTRDVTWAGKEPFPAYRVYLDHGGKRYEYVIPKGCGNFALRSVSPIPVPPPPARAANQLPSCRLELSSQAVRAGNTVTARVEALDSDGKVTAVTFRLKDPMGKTVWETTDTETPFVQEITVPAGAKAYSVEAEAIDDQGGHSDSACTQALKVTRWPGGPVVDLGYAYIFDPANFLFGRVGYELPLVDGLHLLGMVGGFWKVEGSENESSFVADLTLNYHFLDRMWVGAGVGYWSGQDGQLDVIANLGCRVYGPADGFNASLFVEARSATDEFEELGSTGRYGAGLRFRF